MSNASKAALSYIIGGSSGMGLATGRLLVAEGASVVLVARDEAKLARCKSDLERSNGGKVETLAADLYDREAVKSLAAVIDNEERRIIHLVNAAGFFIPKPFLEAAEIDYDSYADLNCGLFFVTQAVVRNMVKHGGGAIVNVGTMWVLQAIKATPSSAYSQRELLAKETAALELADTLFASLQHRAFNGEL